MLLLVSLIFFNIINTRCVFSVCTGFQAGTVYTCNLDDLHNFTTDHGIFMDVLRGNPVRFLTNDDLKGFGNYVDRFYIRESINGIENGTFDWLTNVYLIRLEGNDLPVIEQGTFWYLSVVLLYLPGNNIRSIQRDAFSHMPKLEGLYLSSNHLKIINAGIFTGLRVYDLDFSHNEIVHIEDASFYGMRNLNNVYFNDNKLTHFYTHRLFNHTKYLVRIELEDNLLTRVGYDNFKNVLALKYIDLNNNIIVDVHSDTFNSTASLKSLRLSGNRLTSVDIFLPMTVTNLYLERNHLSYVPDGFLSKLVGLKAVGLYGNPWKCSCYSLLLKWSFQRKVKLVPADDRSFSQGKKPVCVVYEDTYEACDKKTDGDVVKKYLKTVLA